MVYRRMRRWSIMPQSYVGSRMPRVTYVVPMTPAASAAQVAMMQNRQQQLMSQAHVERIEHAVDDAHHKAENAIEMAATSQEQLSLNMQNLLQNQGVMFLLIACFIILFIFLVR